MSKLIWLSLAHTHTHTRTQDIYLLVIYELRTLFFFKKNKFFELISHVGDLFSRIPIIPLILSCFLHVDALKLD